MPSVARAHQLVARNWKLLKHVWRQASQEVQNSFPNAFRSAEAIAIPIRSSQGSNIPTAAYRKQIRHFTTSTGLSYQRSSLPSSRVTNHLKYNTGRTPFASTLRPNLTGGTLNRTAGGYSLGGGKLGGARYFSHGPAAPAQVIQNVSQAVRAFALSGQKARFDGSDPTTGAKRYRAVTTLQDDTVKKMEGLPQMTPGSYVDFKINPTITALTPLSSIAGFEPSGAQTISENLGSSGLLDVLSADFSRALRDLAAVLHDLNSLATLGDLPLTYDSKTASLRVHFAGCDSETVEDICLELGVSRGLVTQDPDFDTFAGTKVALLFPFAPSADVSPAISEARYHGFDAKALQYPSFRAPRSPSIEDSTQSESGDFLHDFDNIRRLTSNKDPSFEDYGSMPRKWSNPSSFSGIESAPKHSYDPLEYQDFEGIYRFIELCDDVRR